MLLVGVLTWPLVFSGSAFTGDWMEQLWFVSKQAQAIESHHLPSLFLNYRFGVFYPHYAFYGATLYVSGALLVLGLGSAPIAGYVLTYLLGFAATYGGWYWLARMFGLGRWRAHVPGVVFVTSSYYLTLIYARGDWPEFIGISMIPPMVASGLSVLRADRLRAGPAIALALSSVLFFGSHSLTIVWGSTTIAVVAVAILICVAPARRALTKTGVLRVGALVLAALLVNAWFLLPAAAYEAETRIASGYLGWRLVLKETMSLVSVHHLFTLSRASASTPGANFALSLPILAVGWAIVSLALALRGGLRNPWTRVLLIGSTLTAALTVLMTHAGLILALPRAYATLQYSYRLESYVLLALSGSILAALALARNPGRSGGPGSVHRSERDTRANPGSGPSPNRALQRWTWVLIPVLAVSVVGAIQQTDAPSGLHESRYALLAHFDRLDSPSATEALLDYIDVHQRFVKAGTTRPAELAFVADDAVHNNAVSGVVRAFPGQLIYTNLFGPPNLVHVAGAKIVGINAEGYDVLEAGPTPGERADGEGPPMRRITVNEASTLPVVLGRWLTLLGVLALAIQFLALALRSRGARARSSAAVRRSRPAPDISR